MSRRSGYSFAMQTARAAHRSARAYEKERLRVAKEQEKVAAKTYVQTRIEETQELNQKLDTRIWELETLLADIFGRWIGVNWPTLVRKVDSRDLDTFPELLLGPKPTLKLPPQASLFSRLFPGSQKRYDQRCSEMQSEFRAAQDRYEEIIQRRKAKLEELSTQTQKYNEQLERFRQAYLLGEPDAVVGFFDLVFENCEYPDWFGHQWKTAFLPESKQLIVDIDLPRIDDSVPEVEQYRYVKTSDQITTKKRSQKSRQALYSSLISQSVLRKLHEIFHADKEEVVDVAVVSAFVETIDKGTGCKRIWLGSLRVCQRETAGANDRQ
jgi:restriction system protein